VKVSPKDEEKLIEFLHAPAIKDNLYNFVMAVYPWGQKGTPLEHHQGPRDWQKEDLLEVTAHLQTQKGRLAAGEIPEMWKKATASGRGPGKSTLVAWLLHWMMTTRIGSTTIITANTEMQLKTRTFAEVSKWLTLGLNAHWWEVSILSVRPGAWLALQVKEQLKIDPAYWYGQGQLWSEENTDAFAGVHNPRGVQVIYDEASGIPKQIFTVTAGFFTEPVVDRYWWVYSNARRNSGGFFDCFDKPEGGWRIRHLDARTVEGLDMKVFDGMIREHGIDSDQVRVEVLGEFPKQGNRQFIGNELVKAAQDRELDRDLQAPLILGLDVARYGDDSTVLRFRKGRDARSIPPIRFADRDNMFIANETAKIIAHYNPDAVNIDAGNGTGVIDRLRELGFKVTEVWFGSKASSPEWADKRTEMWADVRDWLGGGCLDADARLFQDLTAPEYHPAGKGSDKTRLQSKEELRDLGYRSPDDGDALALTFATHVARKDLTASKSFKRERVARDLDYSVFT
jgi:hypothetical protein